MTQRTTRIFIGVLIALLFINFYALTKLSSFRHIESELYYMGERLDDQAQELNYIREELHKINEKEKLISSHDYFIENINNNYEKANVEVEVEFSRLKNNSTPYLIYSIQGNENSSEKVELTNDTGLKYKAELVLSYSHNYDVQMIIENDEEIISEELSSIELLGDFNNRLSLVVWPKEYKENKKIEYEIQIFNDLGDDSQLGLEEVKADVYYIDKKIDSIDIIENGKEIKNDSTYQEWTFKDTFNIEDIKDENVQEKILFKFRVVTGIGKEYKLERKFTEFIAD